jgi:hypothetical protein
MLAYTLPQIVFSAMVAIVALMVVAILARILRA